MTAQEIKDILCEELKNYSPGVNPVFQGLSIVNKYIPGADLGNAWHDQVSLSCYLEDLGKSKITKEDVEKLRMLGWFWDDETDSVSHFV